MSCSSWVNSQFHSCQQLSVRLMLDLLTFSPSHLTWMVHYWMIFMMLVTTFVFSRKFDAFLHSTSYATHVLFYLVYGATIVHNRWEKNLEVPWLMSQNVIFFIVTFHRRHHACFSTFFFYNFTHARKYPFELWLSFQLQYPSPRVSQFWRWLLMNLSAYLNSTHQPAFM